MTDAQAHWDMMTFGDAVHSFTNATAHEFGDARLRYDPVADRQSWSLLLDLLERSYSR
jgi:dienelactone hydrolase